MKTGWGKKKGLMLMIIRISTKHPRLSHLLFEGRKVQIQALHFLNILKGTPEGLIKFYPSIQHVLSQMYSLQVHKSLTHESITNMTHTQM